MMKSETSDVQMYQNDVPPDANYAPSNYNNTQANIPNNSQLQIGRSSQNIQTTSSSTRQSTTDMQRSVDDVPFRFHSSIEASLNQDHFSDISDVIPNIWTGSSEYEYNFFTERSVLEDT